MTQAVSPEVQEERLQGPGFRRVSGRLLCGITEAGILALVCLSPWVDGVAEPVCGLVLSAGVAALLALWGLRLLLEGKLTWKKCPVALCLAALFLGGAWQVVPLPRGLLGRLSPATARWYDQLLPSQPEVLPQGEKRDALTPRAGSTISLYPYSTRRQVLQLLAVFSLFAVVRNLGGPAGGLRRLSTAVLVNGTFLAVFGVVQSFTAPGNLVYWTYPSGGEVFGPFTHRSDFAAYLNLCVGLGVGLLLSRFRHRARIADLQVSVPARRAFRLNIPALGTGVGLTLMLGALAFCQSWGSLLALPAGCLVCGTILLIRSRQLVRHGAALLGVAAVLGCLVWCGWDRVQALLAVPGKVEEFQQDRLSWWSGSWRLVQQFPVWGTGMGTFSGAEFLEHGPPADRRAGPITNCYLEALVEGGVIRLALSLAAIGLIFWLGYRASIRPGEDPAGGLALGALLGFTTLVFGACLDGGIHVPAVALLATVLCARLGDLGSGKGTAGPEENGSDQLALRLGGLAAPLGMSLALALGVVLLGEGWREYKVSQWRAAASRLDAATGLADRERRIEYLEGAARLAPGDALLQTELAEGHAHLFQEQREKLQTGDRLSQAAQAISAVTSAAADLAWTDVPLWLVAWATRESVVRDEDNHLTNKHLTPALRHFLQARDACPLWVGPQLGIAEYADHFEGAQPRGIYLERAERIAPLDPVVWYRCGLLQMADRQPDQARQSWRRSLELSDLYLSDILARCAGQMDAQDILREVLPDQPRLLLDAAWDLYPDREETAERKPFLEKALALLRQQPGPREADDLHVEGEIEYSLGHWPEAAAAYQAALAREPQEGDWRYDYAKALNKQGQFQESRRELLTLLEQEPEHTQAHHLLNEVDEEIADQK